MACAYHVQPSSYGILSVVCLVLSFVLIELSDKAFMHCIHDVVQEEHVDATYINYGHEGDKHFVSKDETKSRIKRNTQNLFEPIRINTQFVWDSEVFEKDRSILQNIVEKAVNKLNRILSVIPVKGPLLLARSPCERHWIKGRNHGKCSQFDAVKPEYCMDYLKIPASHLKGFSVFNNTHPSPVFSEPDGAGIQDADYVLYVTSQQTSTCRNSDTSVVAYASFCRVDQNGRPVAGHVNFCPTAVRRPTFSVEEFYVSALHELFHALGFSKKLFSKFKSCSDSGKNCTVHPAPVVRPEDGILRLVTPHVMAETQAHFHCAAKDYGGPMDITNTSHWDSRTMQGSLMAAKLDLPHLTFVDRISLALFEDTGWYRVDYSQADQYLWGRGAGCDFGLPSKCHNQKEYFCSGRSHGCHYLHWDKASCRSSIQLTPCSVFKSKPGDECWNVEGDPIVNKSTLEVFSRNSRCFLSNITKSSTTVSPLTGKCFHHHCYDRRTLMVRVDNSSWTVCPAGLLLQIPGYAGLIQCPRHPLRICSVLPAPLTTVPTTIATTTEALQTEDPTVPYDVHRESTPTSDANSHIGHPSVLVSVLLTFLCHQSLLIS